MEKRSLIKSIFWKINISLAITLSLGWLVYYLPPKSATTLSVLGFIVPILLMLHVLFLLLWAAKKKKKAFLSLLCLILSFLIFGTFYRFSPSDKVDGSDSFSVMSYNVRSLNRNDNIPLANVDSSIISFMLKETPDILVVQEAHYAMRSITPLDEMYPYKFVDFEYGVPQTNVINALYSKYPITNVQLIDFPKSDNGALFVDIALKSDTIRVYNAHLQSFNVVPDMEHLQNEASRKLFRRIIQVLKRQEEQVLTILEHIIVSPYPVLLAGDLNNTQFSKVYRVMRSDLQDSFLEAGSGFGKTFKIFDLPMRIDYIFADRHFEVTEHTNYNVELSDHEPVMARLRLKSDK